MNELTNYCRFCACDGIFQFDIFQLNEESNSSIAEDLYKLCSIKLENNEGLPSKICTNCNLNLISLKDFLTNLNKTQLMLLEFQNYFYRIKKKCELLNKKKAQKENSIDFSIIEFLEGNYNDFNRVDCNSQKSISDISMDKDEKSKTLNNLEKIEDSVENEHNTKSEICRDRLTNMEKTKNDNKKDTLIECEICGQKCSNQRGLSVHKRKKHFNEKYSNNITNLRNWLMENGKKISQNQSLVNNETDSEVINNLKTDDTCGLDNESFKAISDIPTFMCTKIKVSEDQENCKFSENFKAKMTTSTYKCNLCGRTCTSKGGLTFHMKKKHLNDKDVKIIQKEKKKEYVCAHCGKMFTSLNGRWSHIYTVHDKSMKVICDECGKDFPTKYHLLKHKAIHKEIKDLQCPNCPAKFKRQSGLHVHIAIHGESFSCEICGLILNTQKLLKDHMIVHSDVRKYKCNFCNKSFKRSRNLYSHIETHVGIRAFQCCACSMNFVQYMTYRKHLKRTHPEKFSDMITKGERISTNNALSSEQLKAINEAAKNGENYQHLLKKERSFENINI